MGVRSFQFNNLAELSWLAVHSSGVVKSSVEVHAQPGVQRPNLTLVGPGHRLNAVEFHPAENGMRVVLPTDHHDRPADDEDAFIARGIPNGVTMNVVEAPGGGEQDDEGLRLEAVVPQLPFVDIQVPGSAVKLTGPLGETHVRAAGDVSLLGSVRRGDIVSRGGDLKLGDVHEYLRAQTGAGDIRVQWMHGDGHLRTGHGNIEIAHADPRQSLTLDGRGDVSYGVGSREAQWKIDTHLCVAERVRAQKSPFTPQDYSSRRDAHDRRGHRPDARVIDLGRVH